MVLNEDEDNVVGRT